MPPKGKPKKGRVSVTMRAAMLTGGCLIAAAVIGGIFRVASLDIGGGYSQRQLIALGLTLC